jgi:hypothetical protein
MNGNGVLVARTQCEFSAPKPCACPKSVVKPATLWLAFAQPRIRRCPIGLTIHQLGGTNLAGFASRDPSDLLFLDLDILKLGENGIDVDAGFRFGLFVARNAKNTGFAH